MKSNEEILKEKHDGAYTYVDIEADIYDGDATHVLDAMKQAQIEILEELWRRLDKNGYKFNSISHIIDNLMIELKEELK